MANTQTKNEIKFLGKKINGYFPIINPTKEKSFWLWEVPKGQKMSFLIESRSIWSDVGSAFYVYDINGKYQGVANTLNEFFDDIKPIRLTKRFYKQLTTP